MCKIWGGKTKMPLLGMSCWDVYFCTYTFVFILKEYLTICKNFGKFYSLLPNSKCYNISLAILKNFVSTPSYYNYTACVYCEGWD